MLIGYGLDEAEIDAEAASLEAWAQGKSKEDIASALKGEGDSPLAAIAAAAKADQYWMYSRFFGIGLVRLMDIVGVEQDMSVAYDCMEEWVGKCMEKPFYTACVSLCPDIWVCLSRSFVGFFPVSFKLWNNAIVFEKFMSHG